MNIQLVMVSLAQQVECYRRLAKLAQVQHEHIRQGRIEQLLDVLKGRQQVLAQMNEFEEIVGPAKRQWEQFVADLDEATRQKAESLMAESKLLLNQITSADQDDALVLQQRKLNIGKEIRQATTARQIHRMYGAAAYGRRAPKMDVQR